MYPGALEKAIVPTICLEPPMGGQEAEETAGMIVRRTVSAVCELKRAALDDIAEKWAPLALGRGIALDAAKRLAKAIGAGEGAASDREGELSASLLTRQTAGKNGCGGEFSGSVRIEYNRPGALAVRLNSFISPRSRAFAVSLKNDMNLEGARAAADRLANRIGRLLNKMGLADFREGWRGPAREPEAAAHPPAFRSQLDQRSSRSLSARVYE